jgi:hypothetical protein
MSFDLFLFRVAPDADFHAARAVLDDLMDKKLADPSFDARDAVDTLLKVEPRYQRREFDYAALARVRRTSEDEVRREFDFVSVDGPMDLPMAQFCFCQSYISINWYSGTSAAELERYLKELCRVTGYAVVDPQNGQIMRLKSNGELG